jgi:hypothetical protein
MADDDTTAVSTVVNEPQQKENEDDIDAMLEEQSDTIEEIQTEQDEINDITMEDKDQNTATQQQQIQQEKITNRITAAITEGDFTHQFRDKTKNIDTINNNSTPAGVQRQ